MTYLAALLIFAAIASVIWFASLSLYRSTVGGPDPAAAPPTGPWWQSPSGRWR